MLDPGQLRTIAHKALIDAAHLDDTAERLLTEAEKTTADQYGETLGRIVRDLRRASYVCRSAAASINTVADKVESAAKESANAPTT